MPSGQAPLPRLLGPKTSTLDGVALLVDSQAGDAAAGRLDDVEPLFFRVEPDFVGEPETVGDDAEGAVLVAREVAVREIDAEGVHPVLHPGRDGDPDAILRVAEDEVDFADRLAVYGAGDDVRGAVAGHDLEAVGAEVRDQEITVTGEGEAVRQRAFEIAAGLAPGAFEMSGLPLGDDLLRAVGGDADDAAAGVGRPQRCRQARRGCTPAAAGRNRCTGGSPCRCRSRRSDWGSQIGLRYPVVRGLPARALDNRLSRIRLYHGPGHSSTWVSRSAETIPRAMRYARTSGAGGSSETIK